MIMINSTTLESDSDKHNCFSINPLLEKKFDDINNNSTNHEYEQQQQQLPEEKNLIKQDILSPNDTTLLTTTTTTMTTVEVKVKTTKTSSRKRKLNLINDNNDNHPQQHDNINKQQVISKKKKNQNQTKITNDDSNNKKKKTIDQSSVTDESSFGSCEPGTSVVLQGIVWNETDKGVLVVNITWRGKTYVGALLNTTEQNWAPPRYKSDIRSTKSNHNQHQHHHHHNHHNHREHQLNSITSLHESTERILRNGKRRGSNTTVTPNSTTKTRSFKIPETPQILTSKIDETNISNPNGNSTITNNNDDEIGDNYSSRSVSPTTSGISTTSSSPPLLNTNDNTSILNPIDLSNTKSTTIEIQSKTNENLLPYHFSNDLLFTSTTNSTSYLPIPSQIYFNYPSVSSLPQSSSSSSTSH